MKDIQCLKCKRELEWIGAVGMFEEANGICKHCGIMYRDDEPIALQKGDKIIKLR